MNKLMIKVLTFCAVAWGVAWTTLAVSYVQEWRGLPDGYTQVEYIESTGSQYIDTFVVPDATTAVDFKFNLVAYESGKAFFGQKWSNSNYLFNEQSDKFYFHGGGDLKNDLAGDYGKVIVGNDYRCQIEPTESGNGTLTLTWGGVTRSCTVSLSAGSGNMRIFGSTDSGHFSKIKVYSMKIWKGGTLVADLVPAKDSNGAGGLYNLVGDGNNWLGNSGSDAFVLGAEVPDPNPDGFTPMLTATGARRIYRLGAYEVYEWTDTGADNGFAVPAGGVIADVLLVGGGGAGGMTRGGGGGGGGVRYLTGQELAAGDYTVTVGAGGIPQYAPSAYQSKDNNGETYNKGITPDTATGGSSSVIGGSVELVALGGGGGGCFNYGSGDQANSAGLAGGCGGGAGGHNEKAVSGGSGTEGQGYAGSNNANPIAAGGGGGGAGAVGGSPAVGKGGDGGAGLVVDITGDNVCYGGGGGGGFYSNDSTGAGGDGGVGGGGSGNFKVHGPLLAQNGVDGLGGGGGGGGAKSNNGWYGVGGVGGSGTVIVRVLLQGMIGLAVSVDNSRARELVVTAQVNVSDDSPSDTFDLYAAIGEPAGTLGEDDFSLIASGVAVGASRSLVFGGLDADKEYRVVVRAMNCNKKTWSEDQVLKATTSSQAYPVTAVGPGIVKTESGYEVSLIVARIQDDVTDCTAVLNGSSKTITGPGTYTWTVPGTASGCTASIVLNYKALGWPVSQTFTGGVSGSQSIVTPVFADHLSSGSALVVLVGDQIILPPLAGTAQYQVLNTSFLSVDGSVLTAVKPGLTGLLDPTSNATMAVIVLPDDVAPEHVFIWDETKSSDSWVTGSNWLRPDGSVAGSGPVQTNDVAVFALYGKSDLTVRLSEDVTVGQIYAGHFKNGASGTIKIESVNGSQHTVTFARSDDRPSLIQTACSGTQTTLTFGGYATSFVCANDTVFDGGWDEVTVDRTRGRPSYASNSPWMVPSGVTLTWRNIDTTGTSMGCTFDAPALSGGGIVWNRSAANIKYSRKSDGFTGVVRDSTHGNGNTDRSGPTYFSAATVLNASAEAYGFVSNSSGSPSCDTKGVGMLCTGWDPAYGSPGFHDNYLPERGLTLVNSTYRCGSTENTGWGKGVAEVKYTEKFTVGRGFSYVHRHNNRDNKSGHPINWFETDAFAHTDKGTIRVDDYHRSNYADVSDTTNTVTILHGIKNFAVGGTGDPKTSENYPIIPWMVTPSKNTDNGKLAFTCVDGDDRICDMGTRTNRELDKVTDEDENAYVNNMTTALTADRTVNSLWIWNQNKEKKFGAGRILTVKSGGVIFRADDSSFGTKDGGEANGAVVLGDATKPGYVFAESTNASKPNSIYAKVTAPGGLVFAYTGHALLAGDQTGIDDELVVNAGTLNLGSQDGTVACTLDVPVRILANASVRMNSITMTKQNIYFDDIAGYGGKIVLNAAESKCHKLLVRDTPEETEWTSVPRGTYSAAELNVLLPGDRFSGDGVLVVRRDDKMVGFKLSIR